MAALRLLILLAFLLPGPLRGAGPAATDPLYDELEGPALAEALVRDGKLTDARGVLSGLSRSESNSALAGKVRGEIALLEGNPAEAARQFETALAAQPQEALRPYLNLGLARSLQRLGRHEECAKAAEAAGELAFRSEPDVLLRAGCERAANRLADAWATLSRARAVGLGSGPLMEHLRLMLFLGLREQASRAVQEQLLEAATPSDALAMAEVLLEAGAKEESLLALETARLRFPYDQDILLAVAPVYFSKGLKRATAEAFSLAAARDRTYAEHAAETLRQAGARQRSRYVNLFIPGEKERGRQKLALAVESSRWDLVASMDSLVRRSALEGDDEVSYALAYSLVRGSERARALSYLESVKTPGLLGKVTALMKTISDCSARNWRCH